MHFLLLSLLTESPDCISIYPVSAAQIPSLIVPLREWTDLDSDRLCYSCVSFIARFVDSCNWAWQLTWPCGGPMLLGGPACRNAAHWLVEVRLGWMSTVHRAGGMRGCSGTPPLCILCSLSPSCTHTFRGTQLPCLSFPPFFIVHFHAICSGFGCGRDGDKLVRLSVTLMDTWDFEH